MLQGRRIKCKEHDCQPVSWMDGIRNRKDLLSFREDQHRSMDVSARRSLMMQYTWDGDNMLAGVPRQFYILVSVEIGRHISTEDEKEFRDDGFGPGLVV